MLTIFIDANIVRPLRLHNELIYLLCPLHILPSGQQRGGSCRPNNNFEKKKINIKNVT